MAAFVFTCQGTSPTTIGGTDKLQFAGSGGFDTRITVGSYNATSHVKSSGGTNLSSANTPKNNKFISQTGGTAGKSQVSVSGGATVDLDTVTTANCVLKINFSDASSVVTTAASIYAWDGTTQANPPSGVTVKIAAQGSANFSTPAGSGSALALADQTAATSHDFFLVYSASPSSVGLKTAFATSIVLTYY